MEEESWHLDIHPKSPPEVSKMDPIVIQSNNDKVQDDTPLPVHLCAFNITYPLTLAKY